MTDFNTAALPITSPSVIMTPKRPVLRGSDIWLEERGGIRFPGAQSVHTHFPGALLRPLGHLSIDGIAWSAPPDSNRHGLKPRDFKSRASTVPPGAEMVRQGRLELPRALCPPAPEAGVSTLRPPLPHITWCARRDSNSHGLLPTSPSSWRVYHSATRAW